MQITIQQSFRRHLNKGCRHQPGLQHCAASTHWHMHAPVLQQDLKRLLSTNPGQESTSNRTVLLEFSHHIPGNLDNARNKSPLQRIHGSSAGHKISAKGLQLISINYISISLHEQRVCLYTPLFLLVDLSLFLSIFLLHIIFCSGLFFFFLSLSLSLSLSLVPFFFFFSPFFPSRI